MADQWDLLTASFMRSLRAKNRAPKTLAVYGEAIERLGDFAAEQGIHDPAELTREHVEAFLTAQLERLAPATVNSRYRALAQWFKWLEAEEEIGANPMRNTSPPSVPERLVPVLADEEVLALFRVCAGKDFASRRDLAIFRLFHDSGLRRGEMAGIQVEDVNLDDNVVIVIGKGNRERMVPFGAKTAAALDRYLRLRAKERRAVGSQALWLGAKGKGPLTADGIAQMVERRGYEAGFDFRLHPHQLRHTFASTWMEAGGGETDLMALAGWKSRQMLSRYGASAAGARAQQAHRRMGLGDRI